MNTLQTIYNKLADKTELASQKVELGLIDDLNKALDESQEVLGGLKKDNQRIDEMQTMVEKKIKRTRKTCRKQK
jgi:hypothetical protein